MNLKDLEYFNEICMSESFTKAAQNLFITQPTITNSINRLETELNTKIFIRSSFNSQVKLTNAGKILKIHSENILNELNNLKKNLDKLETKEITFGTPPLINTYFLPKITETLLENKIFRHMKFVEEGSSSLIDMIIENKLDLAIIAYLEKIDKLNNFNLEILKHDKFKFCIGKNHELNNKAKISFKDLDNRTFIVLKETYLDNTLLHKMLKEKNINAKKIINADSVEIAKSLIASGTGIGIMFNLAIEDISDLIELQLPEDKFLTVALAYNKNHILRPCEQKLYNIILSKKALETIL
ncbi:MAG: LysR family transcriptional regulator [Sarcina sp.]